MPATDETPVTEIVAMNTLRVDAVGGPANGIPFLVLKSIEKSEADQRAGVAEAQDLAGGEKNYPDAAHLALLPDGDGDYAEPDGVTKADAGDGADPLEVPGSGAWEAQDAAALRDIATQLAGLCDRIGASADREMTEFQAGQTEDIEDVWDLQDAMSALDCALAIVARMAFTEAQEAVTNGPDGQPLTKSTDPKAMYHLHAISKRLADLLGQVTNPDQEVDMTHDELTKALDARDTALLDKLTELVKPAEVVKAEAPAAEADKPAETSAAEVTKAEAPTETAPTQVEASTTEVAKSEDIADAIVKKLESGLDARFGDITKRLDVIEKQPARPRPLMNGVSPMGRATEITKSGEALSPNELAEITKAQSQANLTALYSGDLA